jgi:Domain of unknown function (DUF4386)
MERISAMSPSRLARIAGGLYLVVILGGFFTIGYVPATIVVSGDPSATAHNLQAHDLLYRLGLVVHIGILCCNVPLAVIFYDLFKVVNRRAALLVVFFTLLGTAVEGATIPGQFAPLTLLQGGYYSGGLTGAQAQALAYLPIDLQEVSYSAYTVFFSFYGLALGYLIFRSRFLPRALGVLLAIGALCYLAYSLTTLLSPDFAHHLVPYIQVPSLVGEGSVCLWLLIAGVNVQQSSEGASAAAQRPGWAQ